MRTDWELETKSRIIIQKTNKISWGSSEVNKIVTKVVEKDPWNWGSAERLKKSSIGIYQRSRSAE